MSILAQTLDGFVLHVERAEKSLKGAPKDGPGITAIEPGGRCALHAPNRAALVRGLLKVWSNGAVPLLLPNMQSFRSLESACTMGFESASSPLGASEITFEREAVLCALLTSGSTGAPQSHEKSARQIFGEALAQKEILGLLPKDVVLATTASHHLYGLLFGVLAPWAAGSSIIASLENEPGSFHPEKIAALAQAHRATHLISVPAHLRALLEAPVQLSTIRVIVSSAAPLLAEDARQLEDKFGAQVIDILGSTETGGLATRRASKKSWSPLPGVRVRLDDESRLLLASPYCADPSREERSDERAHIHQDGTFEYLGRADQVVKVGGKRLDLLEIETLIGRLPGVSECACLSRSVGSLRGEEVLLVVATATPRKKDEIISALRGHVDPTFFPRRIRMVERLPRDERGKLKRADLIQLFQGPEELPKSTGWTEKSLQIPADWSRFSGHFEGDPLLPALSQLADIILPAIREAFGGGALASLRRVKWTRPVRPGAKLSLRLDRKPHGINFQLWEGPALACSGTATLQKEGA